MNSMPTQPNGTPGQSDRRPSGDRAAPDHSLSQLLRKPTAPASNAPPGA
jgi:hypothetical protein